MSKSRTPPENNDNAGLSEDEIETFQSLAEAYDEDEPIGAIANAVLQSAREESTS